MRRLTPLLIVLLNACGMQGDLYEPAPPAEPAAAPEPTSDATDMGERKKIPATPDPAKSQ